jgi:hypothetical protein
LKRKEIDMDLLIIIGILLGLGGIIFFTIINKEKNWIDTDDVLFVAKVFNLSMDIIKELNLKEEEKIKLIGDIVSDTLFYAESIMDEIDYDEMLDLSIKYALELCEKFDIEITEERIRIITTLFEFGLDAIIKNNLENSNEEIIDDDLIIK